MKKRLSRYKGAFPLWCWLYPQPDVFEHGHLAEGAQGVLAEMLVSPSRVLLSDFDAWYHVLNLSFLPLSWEEDKQWDMRFQTCDYQTLPQIFQDEIHTSWERIFDFETLDASELWKPVRYVQAVIEYITTDDVYSIRPFTAPSDPTSKK